MCFIQCCFGGITQLPYQKPPPKKSVDGPTHPLEHARQNYWLGKKQGKSEHILQSLAKEYWDKEKEEDEINTWVNLFS